ncbi:MAG: hypothetical protein NW241_02375 [Bacteroidia bacterium]|nr:hypothetical protein [Bacteroidia bacterium]
MHVLAVHSQAVHGTASLKALGAVLGSALLPVPSLLLTGLTNIPGHRKFALPFGELLEGSLELARSRSLRLVLYVGYLGGPEQAGLVLDLLERYRDIIGTVLVDPVSGDHGRLYVPDALLEAWPRLLAAAGWALPNYTELCLYSGLPPAQQSPEACLEAFRARYPQLRFAATSLPAGERTGIALWDGAALHRHTHPRLPRNFGGSGDVFGAWFVRKHLLEGLPAPQAMRIAALRTRRSIAKAIRSGLDDLPL